MKYLDEFICNGNPVIGFQSKVCKYLDNLMYELASSFSDKKEFIYSNPMGKIIFCINNPLI